MNDDDQFGLFDEPDFDETLPYQRHSETSRAAAEQAEPTAGTQRARVLVQLRESCFDGQTDEEIQTVLRMNPSTERPRRIELVNQGHVRDSGRTRETRSGRSAVVWIAREFFTGSEDDDGTANREGPIHLLPRRTA